MPWKCADCGDTFSTSTAPDRCSCGHGQFSFVSKRDARTPDPMDLSERTQPSSAPAEDSSPDVNPDGSLGESRVDTEIPSEVSTAGRVSDSARSWFHIGRLRVGSTMKQLVRLVGISMIVLGAFNFLLAPLVAFGPFLVGPADILTNLALIAIGLIVVYLFV